LHENLSARWYANYKGDRTVADIISRVLIGLLLLVAGCAVRAEELVPASQRACPPSADWWTPQEKFVWARVCIGEEADFNVWPGYGGHLNPKMPEGWPDNRVLQSAFLETIVLKDPYRRALTRHGVVIVGARFVEKIDLEGAELQQPLLLDGSLIEEGADFRRIKSRYPISFARSKVAGVLNMNGLDLDANLTLADGEFDTVDLVTAHVGGQINLNNSKVHSLLDMGAAPDLGQESSPMIFRCISNSAGSSG
jgi:hypothetical protein